MPNTELCDRWASEDVWTNLIKSNMSPLLVGSLHLIILPPFPNSWLPADHTWVAVKRVANNFLALQILLLNHSLFRHRIKQNMTFIFLPYITCILICQLISVCFYLSPPVRVSYFTTVNDFPQPPRTGTTGAGRTSYCAPTAAFTSRSTANCPPSRSLSTRHHLCSNLSKRKRMDSVGSIA